jgi:integrase
MDEESVRMKDICNAFLNAKRRAVEAGELEPRTFRDYKRTTDALIAHFKGDRPAADITPGDLGLYREELAKTNGPVALGNAIQRVRSVFKFAYENDILDKPLKFGSEFKKPSRKVMRQMRATQPKRYLAAHEIHAMIEATKPMPTGIQLRAMILLGLNCGLGNNDIAELNWAHLDLAAGILDYPRPKTGIERRATLWPETVKALRALRTWATAKQTTGFAKGLTRYRPESRVEAEWARMSEEERKPWATIKSLAADILAKDGDAVFITRHQVRFVQHLKRTSTDSVGLAFGKLLRTVRVKAPPSKGIPVTLRRDGVGFYSLRHVFETHAGETRDQPAVDRIMGHTDDGMAGHYREWHKDAAEDARLRVVTDHVRQWFYRKAKH